MEENEIMEMENEVFGEENEELAESGNGYDIVGGLIGGLTVLAGLAACRYIVKPIASKIKDKLKNVDSKTSAPGFVEVDVSEDSKNEGIK